MSADNPRRRHPHKQPATSGSFGSASGPINAAGTSPAHSLESSPGPSSSWAHFSFALAALPAVAGMLFEDGSAIGTDVMLLVLCSVFLRWCVTQPWKWYHTAQQVRIRSGGSGHVTEEEEEKEKKGEDSRPGRLAREKAVGQLHRHEATALAGCFLCPLVGAYLVHHIRTQLSRPSGGLVSDFNLAIFLLASELRPVAHAMKLLQSRTLHLQRVLAENPYHSPTLGQSRVEALVGRLEHLEARVNAALKPSHAQTLGGGSSSSSNPSEQSNDTSIAREVQRFLQPELEVLGRAVRRAEKRTMTLAMETDSRLQRLQGGMEDSLAISAAAAAAAAAAEPGMLRSLADSAVALMLLPLNIAVGLFAFPFRTLSGLVAKAIPLKILGASPKSRPERHHMPSRLKKERIMAPPSQRQVG